MTDNKQANIPDWFVSADESQREMSIRDFFRVIPYQKKWFFLVFAGALLVGLILLSLFPRSYVATSEILMERENTFSVTSAASTNAGQESLNLRMRAIIATLLASENVEYMLQSLGIASPDESTADVRGKINTFKNSVDIEFENVSFINERTGREAEYSLGFKVSYENRSPELSYMGAKELTDRILSYSSDRVAAQVKTETEFLSNSLSDAESLLDEAERNLTEYKEANAASLPHMHDVNVRRIDDLRRRIATSGDRLIGLRDRLEETEAQIETVRVDTSLYSTSGAKVASPGDQLMILELEYAALKRKYAPTHPDLIRLEEEMEALKSVLSTGGSSSGGMEQALTKAQQELADLRNRYSERHPDIAAKAQEVEYLKQQIRGGNLRSRSQIGTTNPVYNNLISRRQSIYSEIAIERQREQDLRDELERVEDGLGLLPGVEQGLRRLEKKRDQAEEKVEEFQAKLAETLDTVDVRNANLSEKFVLLEPPTMPSSPSKPNIPLMMLGIGILSLILAYLFVFIRHMMREIILDSSDVERVAKVPIFLIPEFD